MAYETPTSDDMVPRGDEPGTHRSRKMPRRPPDDVWAKMSATQREAYVAWQRYYRDMLVDEERDRARREYGY